MMRRPPRSTLDRSSAASDVYKRQPLRMVASRLFLNAMRVAIWIGWAKNAIGPWGDSSGGGIKFQFGRNNGTVSYTHLRAHETVLDLVCRLMLEKKTTKTKKKKTTL